MRVPSALTREYGHEPAWLEALPRLVAECATRWALELEDPFDTPHSLVVPAGDAVLKLNAPSHFEAEHEADALELWDGREAVRLLDRDDTRRALLLERCRPGERLRDRASVGAAGETHVIPELLTQLELELGAEHPFRLLIDEAARWADELPTRYELDGRPFERSLLDVALDVFGSVDPSAAFLVNQDLHGLNVLSAERRPWLVIDPKPLVGEREIDAVGVLRNAAAGRALGPSIEEWLDVFRDLGLDRERARGWGVAHALAWGWDERNGWSSRQVEVAQRILAA